tara:strand:- start:287 stop:427 length:141 start_codon:yes stop_codon:yes gene_type:complete
MSNLKPLMPLNDYRTVASLAAARFARAAARARGSGATRLTGHQIGN